MLRQALLALSICSQALIIAPCLPAACPHPHTFSLQLGQALSIRPDLLSPAAMNEMQKLCDKARSNG